MQFTYMTSWCLNHSYIPAIILNLTMPTLEVTQCKSWPGYFSPFVHICQLSCKLKIRTEGSLSDSESALPLMSARPIYIGPAGGNGPVALKITWPGASRSVVSQRLATRPVSQRLVMTGSVVWYQRPTTVSPLSQDQSSAFITIQIWILTLQNSQVMGANYGSKNISDSLLFPSKKMTDPVHVTRIDWVLVLLQFL